MTQTQFCSSHPRSGDHFDLLVAEWEEQINNRLRSLAFRIGVDPDHEKQPIRVMAPMRDWATPEDWFRPQVLSRLKYRLRMAEWSGCSVHDKGHRKILEVLR